MPHWYKANGKCSGISIVELLSHYPDNVTSTIPVCSETVPQIFLSCNIVRSWIVDSEHQQIYGIPLYWPVNISVAD